jgi:hypothetical protein
MPLWSAYWGSPRAGFGWMFPLIGLVFMAVMVVVCIRMMGGLMRGGCMPRHPGQGGSEVEDLRKEIRELKDEIQRLRERA